MGKVVKGMTSDNFLEDPAISQWSKLKTHINSTLPFADVSSLSTYDTKLVQNGHSYVMRTC